MNQIKKNLVLLSIITLTVLVSAFTPLTGSRNFANGINISPDSDESCKSVNALIDESNGDLYQSSYANRKITLNIREGQTEKQAFNNAQRVLSGYDFDIEARDEFQIKTSWVFRDSNKKRVRVLINNISSDDYLVFSFKFQSEEKSGVDWVTVDEIPNKYKELLSEIRFKLTGF